MPHPSNLWPVFAVGELSKKLQKKAEEFDREYIGLPDPEPRTTRCSLTGTDCTADERTCGGWCGGMD